MAAEAESQVAGTDRYALPLHALNLDARVYLIDANGLRVTEITPGQEQRHAPTAADRMAVADWIAGCCNRSPPPRGHNGGGRP